MDVQREYVSEFIECYKSHPALWDVNNPNYMSQELKSKGYGSLLKIMLPYKKEASVTDVKSKINSLRSCYRREVHKIISSRRNNDEKPYVPKLWWYSKLHFLKLINTTSDPLDNNKSLEFVKQRRNSSNIKAVNKTEEDSIIIADESGDEFDSQYEGLIDVTIEMQSKPKSTLKPVKKLNKTKIHTKENDNEQEPTEMRSPPMKKTKKSSVTKKVASLEKQLQSNSFIKKSKRKIVASISDDNRANQTAALPLDKSTATVVCTSSLTDDESFQHLGMVWAKKLRSLQNLQRLIAEKSINEILFQAELGTLSFEFIKRLSAAINESCTDILETSTLVESAVFE